jgi:hypothetical protein
MNSGFYSTDSIFHEWCLDYFNYMWQIAKSFDDQLCITSMTCNLGA